MRSQHQIQPNGLGFNSPSFSLTKIIFRFHIVFSQTEALAHFLQMNHILPGIGMADP